jgi:hypothetical protein
MMGQQSDGLFTQFLLKQERKTKRRPKKRARRAR